MGLNHGTNIVKDGLVFSVDAANPRSYISGSSDTFNLKNLSITGSLKNGVDFTFNNNLGVFELDGSDDLISVNNKFNLVQQTGVFSISCWFKLDNYNSNALQTIMQTNNSGNDGHGWWLAYANRTGIETNTLFFILYRATSGQQDRIDEDSAISDNNWHFVTVTGDDTNISLYLDGVSLATPISLTKSPSGVANNNLTIGDYNSSHDFDGQIGLTQIYNRTLSAAEVLQNYNALKGRFN